MISSTVAAVLTFISVVLILVHRFRQKPSLPPSPPGLPLLGHVHLIPVHYPEHYFDSLAKIYGDIVYVHIPGRSMVVLNTLAAANDLLEKRGVNYSDRPRFTMLEDIMGWTPTLTFLPYGKRSKKQRRMLQQYLSSDTLRRFQPYQTQQARLLAIKLASDPHEYEKHVKHFVTSLIMMLAFGHQVQPENDAYIKMAEDITYTLDNSGAPGASPPDFIPLLRHLPPWFPFASFSRFGHNWKWAVRKIHDYPIEHVQKQVASGSVKPSFVSAMLENLPEDKEDLLEHMDDIKGIGANIFCAGNDTTMASIIVFMLCMVLHPDVQRKAQEEIDRVVGPNRLPEFSDRTSLPYVEGVVQETLRWHPVVPLGIPHKSSEDDIFQGHLIPGGTVILANAHTMSRDQTVYSDPEQFKPERFLPTPVGNGEPHFDPAFGFGRRVCPGAPLADAAIWVAAATILATLRLGDGKGTKYKFLSGGIISHPEPFNCPMEFRSKTVEINLQHSVDHE